MEPIDKLEIILKRMIDIKEKEIARSEGEGHIVSSVYMNGLRCERDGIKAAFWKLRAIKENSPTVSDEIIQKMVQ